MKGSVISQKLIRSTLGRYTLLLEGIHGVPHWARVLENGRRLSEATGAERDIVELFAVFHDSRRINEGVDDGHGRRGAELARDSGLLKWAVKRSERFFVPDLVSIEWGVRLLRR